MCTSLLSCFSLLFPFAWPQQTSLCPSSHWLGSTLLMILASIPLQTSLFHTTTALKWSGTFSARSLPMLSLCYSTLTWELGTGLSQTTKLLLENGLFCMLFASSRRAMDLCIWFWTAMTQSHSPKASEELMFALVSPLSRMPTIKWLSLEIDPSSCVSCRWGMVWEDAFSPKHDLWESVFTEEAQGELG